MRIQVPATAFSSIFQPVFDFDSLPQLLLVLQKRTIMNNFRCSVVCEHHADKLCTTTTYILITAKTAETTEGKMH